MFSWITHHKIISSIIVITFVGGVLLYASSGSDPLADIETTTVERQTVRNIISETGVLEATSEAALGFSVSGRVDEILVREGDVVEMEDVLIQLRSQSAQASLAQAEANLAREKALLSRQLSVDETSVAAAQEKVMAAEDNLAQVTQTQNKLVQSARENLYTSNLDPYLAEGEDEGSDSDFTSPTITGTYEGQAAGEYRLEFYRSQAQSGWSFRISGLESDVGRVSTSQPQPLGDRGLFIEFPDNFAASLDTEWVLEIPNTRSSGYTTLKNALEQAENTRESAIVAAENSLDDARAALAQARSQAESDTAETVSPEITSQQAAVAVAQAQVQQAQSALEDTILRAPFAGIVTDIDITVGENTSAGQPVASIMSDEQFEISIRVPEVDSSQIDIGDPVEIQFDAYEDDVFTGSVDSISPIAQISDGVRTVEVTVIFNDLDTSLRSGLSADVDITAEVSEATLAVPGRSLQRDANSRDDFVYVHEADGSFTRQSVTTGIRGSNGMVEIRSGLSAGQEVATFISSEARTQLEAGEASQ